MTIKGRLLVFFKDEKSWEALKEKFNAFKVKKAQWEGGVYVIINDVNVHDISLDELKENPNVYKIIFSRE